MKRFFQGFGQTRNPGKATQDMKEKLLAKARGEPEKELSFKDEMRMKLEKKKSDMITDLMTGGGTKNSFRMPGTKQEEYDLEKSKSYQQAMSAIKAKQEAKLKKKEEKKKTLVVKPGYIGSLGRIDGKGRIWDNAGKHILNVDKKTGKISNKMGFKVGTYDPTAANNDWNLQNLIRKYNTQQGDHGTGSFWGGGGSSNSGTGSFWGNNDDNNNGGGGFYG